MEVSESSNVLSIGVNSFGRDDVALVAHQRDFARVDAELRIFKLTQHFCNTSRCSSTVRSSR
eukprot:m.231587 g.231587  ORF g.231587 m.231587 type:complete len:62 (+) comp54278_c1_seq11:1030-1215(+)